MEYASCRRDSAGCAEETAGAGCGLCRWQRRKDGSDSAGCESNKSFSESLCFRNCFGEPGECCKDAQIPGIRDRDQPDFSQQKPHFRRSDVNACAESGLADPWLSAMKAFMISSMQSDAGKTVTSCALMAEAHCGILYNKTMSHLL